MEIIKRLPKTLLLTITVIIFLAFLAAISILLGKRGGNRLPNISSISIPTPIKSLVTTPFPNVIPTPFIVASDNQKMSINLPVQLTFTDPFFPERIKMYRVSTYGIDENNANRIARNLSFVNSPSINTDANNNKIFLWQDKDTVKSLQISLNSGYVEYASSYTPEKPDIGSPTLTTVSSPEETIAIAKSFLRDKNLYSFNSSITPSIKYHAGGGSVDTKEVADFSQASLFEIIIPQTIEGKTIYYQYGHTNYISIWIDSFKTVRKLTYRISNLGDYKEVSLISLAEAKNLIKQGKISISRYGAEEYELQSSPGINSITFSSVSLGYLDDRTSGFFYPIYVFEGKATDKNGQQKDIIVYVPASK